MINNHRVFLPGVNGTENGKVADTRYKEVGNQIVDENLAIRIILNKIMGKDISNNIDKPTYYTILQYSLKEIQQIYTKEDGSEY